jgi:hypothetical protein
VTTPRFIVLACVLCALSAHAQGGSKKSSETSNASNTSAASQATANAASAASAQAAMASRGPTRLDFDDRLLQGQTNKLGAVYLYHRRAPAQPSLLSRHGGFKGEIARDILE